MVLVFDQGTNLLRKGSEAHGYGLNLEMVIRIWRGGCIIRAALLEDILEAFRARPDLPSLMADPRLGREVTSAADDLRAVVCGAASAGLPVPGFSSSLSYLDAFRSPHLPANLVQAQRDYFGSHSYERIDERGTFHTRWEES
jgi:6-phosphogluconate dehydrogenase